METDSIAKLLNPDGYCVPELKDFFKKREAVNHEKRSKKEKFNVQKENNVKNDRMSKENMSSGFRNDTFNISLQTEDTGSDNDKEIEVPPVKRIRRRKRKVPLDEEKELRTVFVGNLPNSWNKMKIRRYFSKYGTVETVRLRCAPLADPRVPKKVAVITKDFHPDRTNIHGFVCFVDKESATNALQANGAVVGDHHVRVDLALNSSALEYDRRKAVFIGNLPFSAEEEELWTLFEKCGAIESVRVLRDRKTGIGKGFAYVNFKTPDAVELALKMNREILKDRELRISRYATFKKKKEKKKNTHKSSHTVNKESPTKRSRATQKKAAKKVLDGGPTLEENKTVEHKHSSEAKAVNFRGQTVSEVKKLKKKKKIGKAEQKKKLLIAKLAAGLSKKK